MNFIIYNYITVKESLQDVIKPLSVTNMQSPVQQSTTVNTVTPRPKISCHNLFRATTGVEASMTL